MKKISLEDRIFVAGAKGMVGKSVCKILKKQNYGLKKNKGIIFAPSKADLNLLNKDEVNLWFQINKPTVVIIAAAKVGGILANSLEPTKFLLDNLKIQINLIEASWKFGVKRLLFLGSSCIYPKFASQPIQEESLLTGELEETNQWYALAKISGIKLCESLRKEHGFDAISLMPTNLYGPNDNYHPTQSHVMASFIKKFCEASFYKSESVTCWGSGNPLREFMHVNDLASAIVFCLESWDPNDKKVPLDKNGDPLLFLNVGTGKDISIKNLAIKVAEAAGYSGNIKWDKSKPDGTKKKQLNISKITQLGWEPTITLDAGIKSTVNLYNENLKNLNLKL